MTARVPVRREAARIARYVGVGACAAAVHFLCSLAWFYGAGFSAGQANALGFLAGFWVSYLGQSHITFRYDGRPAGAVLRWFLVAVIGLVASSLVAEWLNSRGVAAAVAVGIMVLTIPVFSYLAGRFWVFKP